MYLTGVDVIPGSSDALRVFEPGIRTVGKTIRRLREQRGYSQEEFAHHAGIARTFYGRIERGEQNLSLKTLFQLALYLNVEPADLLKDVTCTDLAIYG